MVFIHQTKLNTSYLDPLKYEPDPSTFARDKWRVKIHTDCGTPCGMSYDLDQNFLMDFTELLYGVGTIFVS